MAVSNIVERTIDIDAGVVHEDLRRLFAVADAQAHTFKINVTSKGSPQDLSGHTVVGYFMTNYHGTVVITGSISGNTATLVLPATCYAYNTGFQLIIRLVSGSTKTAIYWGSGYVTRSATSPEIDPGGVVPDLDDLLAKLDEMEAAKTAANTAAANANEAASKSVRYDTAQSLTDAQKVQAKSNIGLLIDNTLTVQGAAAESKKTGGEIDGLKEALNKAVRFDIVQNKTEAEKVRARENIGAVAVGEAFSMDAKKALLRIFRHVGYIDSMGKAAYRNLENAFGLSIIELYPGDYTAGYGASNVYPYKDATNLRMLYFGEDIVLEPGEYYSFTWDLSTFPKMVMLLYINTEHTDSLMDQHVTLTKKDFIETGKIYNGDVLKVPALYEGSNISYLRRFAFATGESGVGFESDNDCAFVTISRTDNVQEGTYNRILPSEDLVVHKGIIKDYPYFDYDRSNRVSYLDFNLFVIPGEDYYFSWVSSRYPDSKILIRFYNTRAVQAVKNNENIIAEDRQATQWLENGSVVTVPETINGFPTACFRFMLVPDMVTGSVFTGDNPIDYLCINYRGNAY